MVILVSIALGGCSVPQIKESVIEHQEAQPDAATQELERDGIPNFQTIADALGCVFAPDSCGK